ncbi:MAG: electron transport complex subunit E [Eubacterium sp.]|nr:electron transport complex subunit E [Eubacterium sp.]
MNKYTERLYNGIIKENPTLVQMLGMCPTLAVTTSAINGVGMGLSTTAVLVLSNVVISALRKIIPDKVRVPAFIVVVASFVTMVQFLLQGYVPSLYESLGIYIPLIVVNCIILGRAESYASKNGVVLSLFDGLGMGLGFTFGLTAIGIVREILGSGQIFGYQLLPLATDTSAGFTPIIIFILAPGAFFVLAMLVAIQNYIRIRHEDNKKAAILAERQSAREEMAKAEAEKAAKIEAAKKAAAEKKAAEEAAAKETDNAEKPADTEEGGNE